MITNARLHWDDDGTPHSLDYGDVYYSRADALGESSYVFIDGNDLRGRFGKPSRQSFTVGELGFGAGLNFLNCCRAFCETAEPGATLHYLACELHPFTLVDMQRWLQRFDELAPWREALLQLYPDHTPGVHQLVLRLPRHRIELTLLYGDATQLLTRYGHSTAPCVNAWFLDGFGPKRNPALWQTDVLQQIVRLSQPGTTLSSYSVGAPLRRALDSTGFRFQKHRGFAGKRHMLTATLGAGVQPTTHTLVRHAVVIGGGMAGCSTAFALAETGWQVTLLESGSALALQASGNLQAVLHCKPGTADSSDNHFNLLAYLFAQRHYAALAIQGLAWQQCGMLHVGIDADQMKRFDRIVRCGRFHPRILQQLDASAASALAGVELQHPCLYFPLSGWLAPAALCEFYTRHTGITVRTNAAVTTLAQQHNSWRVELADGSIIDTTDVVLCNAADAYAFPQCRQLPLISNRGQVDVYATSPATALRTVLCGQGYLTPSAGGLQSLGGSYYVEETSTEKNRQTHLTLLSRMDANLAHEMSQQRPVEQRVGQRCQTPDRMPLAGLVSPQYPGLYINAAHGSNGLARTPISAALLASMMNSTPPPLTDALCELLNPARF